MFNEESLLILSLALQPAFPGLCPLTAAVEKLATDGGIEERGAIFTRREVVEFILDLTGYTAAAPLTEYRLLEPSFGVGDFLLPAIDRLIAVAARDGKLTYQLLADAIRAVELHRATYEGTRTLVAKRLRQGGLSREDAARLCDAWLYQGNFLLADFEPIFSHVVGNPPYVRQEAMLLEDCDRSNSPVTDKEPHFPVDPAFKRASYAQRYDLLCKRLVQEGLYSSATFLSSPRDASADGRYHHLSELTSLKTFVTEFAGHIAAVAAR